MIGAVTCQVRSFLLNAELVSVANILDYFANQRAGNAVINVLVTALVVDNPGHTQLG